VDSKLNPSKKKTPHQAKMRLDFFSLVLITHFPHFSAA
jgi:hypothetical protein